MNSTIPDPSMAAVEACVTVAAVHSTQDEAEEAVRRLAETGTPIRHISIIGQNFATDKDIQGFYRPADAALDGAETGAWFGGFFGLMAGAMGFFVFPMLGAVTVLGPIAGLIAGAIGGAGFGALVNAMVVAGIPRHKALKYHHRIGAGEFLVITHQMPETVTGAMTIGGQTYFANQFREEWRGKRRQKLQLPNQRGASARKGIALSTDGEYGVE
ncbi:MAG: general stress protein [Capsulimonas sp.]|uniref:general stress protein n=1 Tax=Capsulimonas sp. TaxID=2494211 RepID=UPI003266BA37